LEGKWEKVNKKEWRKVKIKKQKAEEIHPFQHSNLDIKPYVFALSCNQKRQQVQVFLTLQIDIQSQVPKQIQKINKQIGQFKERKLEQIEISQEKDTT
jgi:hypothetical protein